MILNTFVYFAIANGTKTATDCGKDDKLLGIIPTWYQYMNFNDNCSIALDISSNPGDLWLIGFGVIDILLRLAGLIAVGFIMYGGFRFVTSQGEAEGIKAARSTVLNAIIGLVITIFASTLVTFVAGKF